MRQLLRITATFALALVFTAGMAFGQDNTANVDQEGNENAAEIEHLGGDNESTVEQVGDN
jgi:hypothetical protein